MSEAGGHRAVRAGRETSFHCMGTAASVLVGGQDTGGVKCIAHQHGSCSAIWHSLLRCWSPHAGAPITTLEQAIATPSLVTARRSLLR